MTCSCVYFQMKCCMCSTLRILQQQGHACNMHEKVELTKKLSTWIVWKHLQSFYKDFHASDHQKYQYLYLFYNFYKGSQDLLSSINWQPTSNFEQHVLMCLIYYDLPSFEAESPLKWPVQQFHLSQLYNEGWTNFQHWIEFCFTQGWISSPGQWTCLTGNIIYTWFKNQRTVCIAETVWVLVLLQ